MKSAGVWSYASDSHWFVWIERLPQCQIKIDTIFRNLLVICYEKSSMPVHHLRACPGLKDKSDEALSVLRPPMPSEHRVRVVAPFNLDSSPSNLVIRYLPEGSGEENCEYFFITVRAAPSLN
jgi:hypothetical protein